jgi:hypothetical protein
MYCRLFQFKKFQKAVIQFTAFFLAPIHLLAANEPIKSAAPSAAESSTIFQKQATQDLYENAVANLIKDMRLSERNVDKCLEIEPLNDQCQFLRLNIQNRKSGLDDKEQLEVLRTKIIDQDEEIQLFKLIRDLEKKIEIHNYSFARQILEKLEKDYPDYPDIIIFKMNLNFLSTETDTLLPSFFQGNNSKALEIYQKRCESIDPMTIRKYIYDLDFCKRKQLM